jgi:hypothetical protein
LAFQLLRIVGVNLVFISSASGEFYSQEGNWQFDMRLKSFKSGVTSEAFATRFTRKRVLNFRISSNIIRVQCLDFESNWRLCFDVGEGNAPHFEVAKQSRFRLIASE